MHEPLIVLASGTIVASVHRLLQDFNGRLLAACALRADCRSNGPRYVVLGVCFAFGVVCFPFLFVGVGKSRVGHCFGSIVMESCKAQY